MSTVSFDPTISPPLPPSPAVPGQPSSIDYTARDYAALLATMFAYAGQVAPKWTSRDPGDLGVVLTEELAVMGDILSLYCDNATGEAFLSTATQRQSLLLLAQMLNYHPHGVIPSQGTVTVVSASGGPPVVLPAGTQFSTAYVSTSDQPLIFEASQAYTVPGNATTQVVNVVQGQTQTQVPVATAAGNPDQTYPLPSPSVIESTVQVFLQGPYGLQTWTQVPALIQASSSAQVFAVSTDATGTTWVSFGDGVNGAAPPSGLPILATFRTCAGAAGNVVAGSVGILVSPIPGLSVSVDSSNVPISSTMVGGADVEPNDSIRGNAPLTFSAQNRAVSLADFKNIAISVPGVTRAGAVGNHWSLVTVYVTGPGVSTPSMTLLNAVVTTLQPVALAGVSVNAAAAAFIGINFGSMAAPLVVQIQPNASQAAVQSLIVQTLQNMFSAPNVDLGMTFNLSAVYRALMGVPGVWWVQIPTMVRADISGATGNADIAFRPSEIPTYGTSVITMTGGLP